MKSIRLHIIPLSELVIAAMVTRRTRPAGAHDLELLAALHERCFAGIGEEVWDGPAIATLLATPGSFACLALADDGSPAGLAVARIGGGDSEILTIGILPECRRRGLGLALIDTVADHAAATGAEALFLEVAADNGAARRLYRTGGFRPVGGRAGYYRRETGRIDAVLLRRDLGPSTAEAGEP